MLFSTDGPGVLPQCPNLTPSGPFRRTLYTGPGKEGLQRWGDVWRDGPLNAVLLSKLPLRPHPRCEVDPRTEVSVEVSRTPDGILVEVSFEGAGVGLPMTSLPPDELWTHTCAEVFVARRSGGYAEWNFSPTGQAARFDFSSYRERVGFTDEVPIRVTCERASAGVCVRAQGQLGLRDASVAAVTAVVRDGRGHCSYWALAHPTGEPDFHDPDGFILDGAMFVV